jgi:hypothetical protein
MRNSRLLVLPLLAAMLATAGCYQAWSGKEPKQAYRENEGGFTDTAARSAYIEKRADELMRRGLHREDAVNQAANDWFSNAAVASQSLTPAERKRRQAESDFAAYYRNSKKDDGTP